ncbi:MAG TPA: hypothetical protein VJB34_06185 [Bdellovibrionota bacterium]|nr:hypothetical protein [Bdellovibrionota bacterium]
MRLTKRTHNFNLPKNKKRTSILKAKKELIRDPYLKLSFRESFQLALDISDAMLTMKRNKNAP